MTPESVFAEYEIGHSYSYHLPVMEEPQETDIIFTAWMRASSNSPQSISYDAFVAGWNAAMNHARLTPEI